MNIKQFTNIIYIAYTAKRYGDRTDPCLTPEETLNANDQLQCHLTHAKQLNGKSIAVTAPFLAFSFHCS